MALLKGGYCLRKGSLLNISVLLLGKKLGASTDNKGAYQIRAVKRLKANNLSNEKYFVGWGTTIPQMPRNFIAEFAFKFGGVK